MVVVLHGPPASVGPLPRRLLGHDLLLGGVDGETRLVQVVLDLVVIHVTHSHGPVKTIMHDMVKLI